jgi:Uma2 family endonuclease
MASVASISTPTARHKIPRLEPGDHLTRAEFERRYAAMPASIKAELVEGVVHMPSPVRITKHGKQHGWIMTWLGTYEAETPGTESADNSTIRLDLENEPQPDGLLRIVEERGGQSRVDEDGFVVAAPELVVEVASSSASYDVHEKKRVYRRNGVREYLVWMVEDQRIEWWELVEDEFRSLPVDEHGAIRSRVFPGLWLNTSALLDGDLAQVLETVRTGTQGAGHEEFVKSFESGLA